MQQKEVKLLIQQAYNKLDEALGELKTAKRDLESAEELVGEAFSTLENIPDDEDFEVDEKDEDAEDK